VLNVQFQFFIFWNMHDPIKLELITEPYNNIYNLFKPCLFIFQTRSSLLMSYSVNLFILYIKKMSIAFCFCKFIIIISYC
jgi:hypothetical protein